MCGKLLEFTKNRFSVPRGVPRICSHFNVPRVSLGLLKDLLATGKWSETWVGLSPPSEQ